MINCRFFQYLKMVSVVFPVCVFLLTGCTGVYSAEKENIMEEEREKTLSEEKKADGKSGDFIQEKAVGDTDAGITEEPEILDADWSEYSEETQRELKQVMYVTEQAERDFLIYGKTGMGKADGVVVDAWFTGFAEKTEEKLYFCVYLGRTDGMDVSSSLAKEIAIRLVEDYGQADIRRQ